jgi:hypothetical protein
MAYKSVKCKRVARSVLVRGRASGASFEGDLNGSKGGKMAWYGAIQLLGKMGPTRLFCTLRKIRD